MNSVDIADQLRNVYRPDGLWMRMRKWWWSIFLWAMGQSVVNAYLVYVRVCEKAGATAMTHLDFHVAVATAWCRTPKLLLDPPKAAAAVPKSAPAGKRARKSDAVDADPATANAQRSYRGHVIEECKQSYQSSPGLHEVEMALKATGVTNSHKTKDCQICSTGLSPWSSKEPWGEGPRMQMRSCMRCGECKFHVCSVECWQVLHGYYKGEWGLVHPKSNKGKGTRAGGRRRTEGGGWRWRRRMEEEDGGGGGWRVEEDGGWRMEEED